MCTARRIQHAVLLLGGKIMIHQCNMQYLRHEVISLEVCKLVKDAVDRVTTAARLSYDGQAFAEFLGYK